MYIVYVLLLLIYIYLWIHIYNIFTLATDQNNVQTIFWDVQNTIVKGNLREGGLIY